MENTHILNEELKKEIEQYYGRIRRKEPFKIQVQKQKRRNLRQQPREIQTHIITNIKHEYVKNRLKNFINHWIKRTKKIEGYYDEKDSRYKVCLLG